MKVLNLILCFLISWAPLTMASEENQLKPFISDYCSQWPEGTQEDPSQWAGCCFTHDMSYWIGGMDNERKEADQNFKSCVKLTGASFESLFMYIGVRIGGIPGDSSFSWGFGWEHNRGYEKNSPEDIAIAKGILEKSEYNNNEVTKRLILNFLELSGGRFLNN